MKKSIFLSTMFFFLFTPILACATGWSGNVNALMGVKMLDDDDWGDFDDQVEFGVMADFGMDSWPISLTGSLTYSYDSDSDWDDNEIGNNYFYTYYAEEGTTVELNLGLKKIWPVGERFNIYVSGGLAVIYGEMEITTSDNLYWGSYYDRDDEDDTGVGGWGSVGCYMTFARHINVGLNLGYSSAEIDMYDEDIDAGGYHVNMLVGYAW
jgi:hypothetical protein